MHRVYNKKNAAIAEKGNWGQAFCQQTKLNELGENRSRDRQITRPSRHEKEHLLNFTFSLMMYSPFTLSLAFIRGATSAEVATTNSTNSANIIMSKHRKYVQI